MRHPTSEAASRTRTLARVLLGVILAAAMAGLFWSAWVSTEADRIAGVLTAADTPGGRAAALCRDAVRSDAAAPPHRSLILFGAMETAPGRILVEGELHGGGRTAVRFDCRVADGRIEDLSYRRADGEGP